MPPRDDHESGMKPFTRKATVIWLGTHQRGKGAITTPSGVLKKTSYGFGPHLKPGRSTNPPELIAAAHAGSFSMALAYELGHAGYSPAQIDTTATVTMEEVAAGWTMTQIHLDVIATVPTAAEGDFIDAALRAKSSCPISRLLGANISMCAKLTRHAAPAGASPQPSAGSFQASVKSKQKGKARMSLNIRP